MHVCPCSWALGICRLENVWTQMIWTYFGPISFFLGCRIPNLVTGLSEQPINHFDPRNCPGSCWPIMADPLLGKSSPTVGGWFCGVCAILRLEDTDPILPSWSLFIAFSLYWQRNSVFTKIPSLKTYNNLQKKSKETIAELQVRPAPPPYEACAHPPHPGGR